MAIKTIKKSSNNKPQPQSSSTKGVAAKAEAKSKATQKVTANARLVDALRNFQQAKDQVKSYLVEMATIIQEEQLTKEEVIVSMMEARNIERTSALSQYSRIRKLLTDPKTLEEIQKGELDLKTARENTKGTRSKSSKEILANAEKVIKRSISTIIAKAKESGQDLQSILTALKVAAKAGGLV